MQSNIKRIGLNTVFLIARKIITIVIAFYSTRLLLNRLGEDDFGLYGLVGSVIVLFGALRGLFSSSIQRFLNAAKGKDDTNEINEIFSLGLKIHGWIALIFIVIVEVGGLFLLPTLNIPKGSENDAFWVFQFAIFTTATTILTVPYDAIIIANERFLTYSVISIIESLLKISIIWTLCFFKYDRIVIYAALYFGITVVVRFINSAYCQYTFKSMVKYTKTNNPVLLRKMTSFAGWQFLGNTGYALANSGLNIIINVFGGVVVNASRAIAYQLMGAVTQFISETNLSFQPQTVKSYTNGNLSQFRRLIFLNTKMAFIMAMLFATPLYLCTPGVLKIWLGEVPQYTVQFTRWILVYLVIRSLHGPIDLMFKATAKLKTYQLTELIIMSINLPISWFALKLGFPYWSVFAIMGFLEIINLIAIVIIASKQVGFPIKDYLKDIIARVLAIIIVIYIYIIVLSPTANSATQFTSILINVSGTTTIVGILSFFVLLSSSERSSLFHKVIGRFFNNR